MKRSYRRATFGESPKHFNSSHPTHDQLKYNGSRNTHQQRNQQQQHHHEPMETNGHSISCPDNTTLRTCNSIPFQSSSLNINSLPLKAAVGMHPRMSRNSSRSSPSQGYDMCSPKSLTHQEKTLPTSRFHDHMQSKNNVHPSDSSTGSDFTRLVRKKYKRNSFSKSDVFHKKWNRKDALKAIALEKEFTKKENQILLLRFPDPELSRDIVKGYSNQIDSVFFQQNTAPRSCIIHLKEGADANEVTETISKIPFGSGFVSACMQKTSDAEADPPITPENVDPFTLYVGNLPSTISAQTVRKHFPTAHRIDIGYAFRMKYTRYAFVRYNSAEEALESFRKSVNSLIGSRSVIVRFRRQGGKVKSMLGAVDSGETLSERSGSVAMPSPGEPEPDEEDSKANVMGEVQLLQRLANPQTRHQRLSSLEEMFKEMDQRQHLLKTGRTAAKVRIKQETNAGDDHNEEEDEEPRCLLGFRYNDGASEVKPDPDNYSLPNEVHDEQHTSDEDFYKEHEKDSEVEFDDTGQVPASQLEAGALNNIIDPFLPDKWLPVSKQEQDVIDIKPQIREGQDNSKGSTSNSYVPFPVRQLSDMEKLYEQHRKFMQRDYSVRSPDEFDEMFARMNSDEEEDEYF